jgi:hypothetical protein
MRRSDNNVEVKCCPSALAALDLLTGPQRQQRHPLLALRAGQPDN